MMRQFMVSSIATFLLLGTTMTPGAENNARAVIERAIKAQGSQEQVAKLTKAWHAKVKGSKDKLAMTGASQLRQSKTIDPTHSNREGFSPRHWPSIAKKCVTSQREFVRIGSERNSEIHGRGPFVVE